MGIPVTNPTERVFGSFTVTKTVTGATSGIQGAATYPMTWSCRPAVGDALTGTLEVAAGQTWTVPADVDLPVGSVCSVTEPADTLPALRDSAFSWDEPAFQLDGEPTAGDNRSVTFSIPVPDEDVATAALVAVGVTNGITQTSGPFTVSRPATHRPVRRCCPARRSPTR